MANIATIEVKISAKEVKRLKKAIARFKKKSVKIKSKHKHTRSGIIIKDNVVYNICKYCDKLY